MARQPSCRGADEQLQGAECRKGTRCCATELVDWEGRWLAVAILSRSERGKLRQRTIERDSYHSGEEAGTKRGGDWHYQGERNGCTKGRGREVERRDAAFDAPSTQVRTSGTSQIKV